MNKAIVGLNKEFLYKLQEDALRIRSLCRSGAKSLEGECGDPIFEDAINNQYLAGDMALDVHLRLVELVDVIKDKGFLEEGEGNRKENGK